MIIDYLVELGLDAGKDYIKRRIDEAKLRSSLKNYIESQEKYKELMTLSDEYDYEGFIEFIRDNLVHDLNTRIFSVNPKARGAARQHILSMACDYASADTKEARYQVEKFVSVCMDIIRFFYKKGIDRRDYILAGEIVDAVNETVAEKITESSESIVESVAALSNKNTSKVLNSIEDTKNTILETVSNGSLVSIDKAMKMVEAGQIAEVGEGIGKVMQHVSMEHPLYPYYGYDYSLGRIRSVPLSSEASIKYPESYKFTGPIKIGGEYFKDFTKNPLDYAYRHQLPITMDVSKAVHYLGDYVDPAQPYKSEKITLSGNPPEFPPAFPCSIKVAGETYYEYVLLRLHEVLDDGTLVINNDEQGGHIHFEISIDPKYQRSSDFQIKIKDAKCREYLNYGKFMKALNETKDFHIYVLDAGQDLIAGQINNVNIPTVFPTIDEEIDFLERVCCIEDKFGVEMTPQGELTNGEVNTVIRISDLVRNDKVDMKWDEVSFTGIIDKHFRDELMTIEDKPHVFSYVGTNEVDLFGATFSYKFMRTFNCAYIENIEKVQKKLEVLDDGDTIKIRFMPGNENTCYETLNVPEEMIAELV